MGVCCFVIDIVVLHLDAKSIQMRSNMSKRCQHPKTHVSLKRILYIFERQPLLLLHFYHSTALAKRFVLVKVVNTQLNKSVSQIVCD